MSKAIEIQAPNPVEDKEGFIKVFLAGSIEMGTAEDWQKKIIKELDDKKIMFLNPRRDDWDSSWEQTMGDNDFTEQVNWELDSLEKADVIVVYFDKDTKSPISLLELGLHAHDNKMVVLCPEGFWRKGNVDIVCDRYNVDQVGDFEELIERIRIRANMT
tara:strand:- start:770 stop:1246 length:477 start_codon:yes stop_codon:yes gene_type:complete